MLEIPTHHSSNVGAGLLAKAVCQITLCQLIHRLRRNAARSKPAPTGFCSGYEKSVPNTSSTNATDAALW